MTIYRKSGGVWTASTVRGRISGSGFANRVVRYRHGGAWVFATSFALAGTPNPSATVYGIDPPPPAAGPGLSITGIGSGNYSFNTVFLSGDSAVSLVGAATIGVYATTTLPGAINTRSATYRTTATDTVTGQTAVFNWTVTLSKES